MVSTPFLNFAKLLNSSPCIYLWLFALVEAFFEVINVATFCESSGGTVPDLDSWHNDFGQMKPCTASLTLYSFD